MKGNTLNIPPEVLEELGWEVGDTLELSETTDYTNDADADGVISIIIRKVNHTSTEDDTNRIYLPIIAAMALLWLLIWITYIIF